MPLLNQQHSPYSVSLLLNALNISAQTKDRYYSDDFITQLSFYGIGLTNQDEQVDYSHILSECIAKMIHEFGHCTAAIQLQSIIDVLQRQDVPEITLFSTSKIRKRLPKAS